MRENEFPYFDGGLESVREIIKEHPSDSMLCLTEVMKDVDNSRNEELHLQTEFAHTNLVRKRPDIVEGLLLLMDRTLVRCNNLHGLLVRGLTYQVTRMLI